MILGSPIESLVALSHHLLAHCNTCYCSCSFFLVTAVIYRNVYTTICQYSLANGNICEGSPSEIMINETLLDSRIVNKSCCNLVTLICKTYIAKLTFSNKIRDILGVNCTTHLRICCVNCNKNENYRGSTTIMIKSLSSLIHFWLLYYESCLFKLHWVASSIGNASVHFQKRHRNVLAFLIGHAE